MRTTVRLLALAVFVCILFVQRAAAIDVVFTIDSQATSITGSVVTNLGTVVNQAPGSNTTTAVGHFLVDVDNPADPTSITFLGGNGFESLQNANGGANFQPEDAPANVAVEVPSSIYGPVYGAARNIAWDFNSSATAVAPDGSYSAPTLTATALSGEYDTTFGDAGITDSVGSVTGAGGKLSSGGGVLDLTLNGSIFNPIINELGITASGSIGGTVVATATFSAANTATVSDPLTPVSVLGGSSQIGGVTAQFSTGTTSGGTFSAQQIPLAGLPYGSLTGLSNFGINSLSQSAQVWDVQYSGGTISGPITLTFDYNPLLLPSSLQADPSALTVEHFNSLTQSWENLGGMVDPVNHTITVTTDSFSPFVLSVPEPSTFVLAGIAAVGLAVPALRRRRNRRS